jgi:hypothetical protein
VKLDNWRHMVNAPMPAFFLVLEYDGMDLPQRAYLVHVGEALIRTVLLRLRELGNSVRSEDLHRRKLSFTAAPSDALAATNGEALLAAIRAHVPTGFDAYLTEKRKLLTGAGGEKGGRVIEAQALLPVTGADPHADKALVDWALGLTREMATEPGATVWDERFGIRYPEPIDIIQTPLKLVAQPRDSGELRLQTSDGRASVAVRVELFTTGTVKGYLQDRSLRVRVVGRYLEALVTFSSPMTVQVSLETREPDEQQRLDDLLRFAQLVRLFEDAGGEVTIDLTLDQRPDLRLSGIAFGVPQSFLDDDAKELAATIQIAWRVARAFNVSPGVLTSVNQLWGQRLVFRALHEAVRGDVSTSRLHFDEPHDPSRPTSFPSVYAGPVVCPDWRPGDHGLRELSRYCDGCD